MDPTAMRCENGGNAAAGASVLLESELTRLDESELRRVVTRSLSIESSSDSEWTPSQSGYAVVGSCDNASQLNVLHFQSEFTLARPSGQIISVIPCLGTLCRCGLIIWYRVYILGET